VVERIQLERTLPELTSKREGLAEELKSLSSPREDSAGNSLDVLSREPNPRYQEVQQEIEKIQREIADGRTLRFMTERHPVIVRLRTRLASLQEELGRTPRDQYAAVKGASSAENAEALAKAASRKLEDQLAEVDSRIAAGHSRLTEIADYLAKIEQRRALAVEHRQDYLKLKQETARLETELRTWGENLGPIRHVLTVEDRNRTIHFTMVEDVKEIVRPVLPTVRTVMIISFGIGLAAGALVVLLLELTDRSYRTVRQLGTSLGLPVIEGVGEIVTAAVARRRVFRKFLLMPVAATLAFGALFTAATVAYRSVESPVIVRAAPKVASAQNWSTASGVE